MISGPFAAGTVAMFCRALERAVFRGFGASSRLKHGSAVLACSGRPKTGGPVALPRTEALIGVAALSRERLAALRARLRRQSVNGLRFPARLSNALYGIGPSLRRHATKSGRAVQLLLCACRPPAVFWAIAGIVVDAFQCQAVVWSPPHIGNEIRKRAEPPVAHRNAASAISRIRLSARVDAALNGRLPDAVFAPVGLCHSMRWGEWHAPSYHKRGAF
jgi:hypothetical protein